MSRNISSNIVLFKNKNLLGGYVTNSGKTSRRKSMRKKLRALVTVVAVVALPFALIMFFFGFEPQINLCSLLHKGARPNYTYSQYMDGSLKANGDSVFIRALTTIAYPGAKAGTLVRNALAD